MTEKRFTIVNMGLGGRFIKEDGKIMEIDRVVDLLNENEQLKQSYAQLKHRHSLLHDECLDLECDKDRYYKDVLSLEKENEQLKQILKDTVSQLDAEISKDHSLYAVRIIVDVKMFRKIKELCK